MSISVDEIFDLASVIPVLTVRDRSAAAPLAKALLDGGLKVVEMTMRTPDALAIISDMKAAAPDLHVGMGTLRTPSDVNASLDAGADFLVSPGLTTDLAKALLSASVPAIPGVATVSEVMSASALGFDSMKFFPAEPAGGVSYLKSIFGPLPDVRFCPTGGITESNADNYLALPNVACVGGTWVAPSELIEATAWSEISANAQRAAKLSELAGN